MTYESYPILRNIFNSSELICVVVALIYYPKVKGSYWKWFVYYLVVIILGFEFAGDYILKQNMGMNTKWITNWIAIPLEFMFFFWLYGLKSLKIKRFYIFSVALYFTTLIIEAIFTSKLITLYNVSYSIGIAFLIIYVILEFKNQIQSDKILEFQSNKMFYINIGVVLGYIGNYPFHAYIYQLIENVELYNFYYKIFLISFSLMYILFTISFIWGKPN